MAKYYFFIFIFLKTTAINFNNYSSMISSPKSLDLSSYQSLQCKTIFDEIKFNFFDQASYHKFKSELEAAKPTENFRHSLDDLGTMRPEKFLALIEVLSKKNNFEGIDVESWILNVNSRGTKKLLNAIAKIQSKIEKNKKKDASAFVSEFHIYKFLTELFKIAQYEKFSLFRSIHERDFNLAIKNLNESYLFEYIQRKLIENNIVNAFAELGMLNNPKAVEKFRLFIKKKKSTIVNISALLLGIPSIVGGYVPPILVGPNYLARIIDTRPDLVKKIMEKGYKEVLTDLTKELSDPIKKQFVIKFSFRVVSLISTLVLISFLYDDFQKELEKLEAEFEKRKETHESNMELVNDYKNGLNEPQTPENIAAETMRKMAEDYKAKGGPEINLDSPEARFLQSILENAVREANSPTAE